MSCKLIISVITLINIYSLSCTKSDVNHSIYSIINNKYSLIGDQTLIDSFYTFLDKYDSTLIIGNGQVNFSNIRTTLWAYAINDEIASININPGNYIINPTNPDKNFNFNTNSTFLGSTINVTVLSSTAVNTSAQVYLPSDFSYSPSPSDSSFSRSHDITFSWTTDPNNYKGVLIELFYDVSLNSLYNPNVTGNNIVKRFLVPDNGSYTISSAYLSQFPACRLSVKISKGNYYSFDINGKQFPMIFANTKQYSIDLI